MSIVKKNLIFGIVSLAKSNKKLLRNKIHIIPSFNKFLYKPKYNFFNKNTKSEKEEKEENKEEKANNEKTQENEGINKENNDKIKPNENKEEIKKSESKKDNGKFEIENALNEIKDEKNQETINKMQEKIKEFKKELQLKDEKFQNLDKKYKINEKQLNDLQGKLKSLRENLMIQMEEVEITRKRAAKEKEDIKLFAITKFAQEILEISDNIHLAIQNSKEFEGKNNNLYEGIKMTENILNKILNRNGVVEINPMKEKFNPNLHEALFEVDDPNLEPGTIAYVASKGFTISKRVLRAPKVGVVKDRPKEKKPEEKQPEQEKKVEESQKKDEGDNKNSE